MRAPEFWQNKSWPARLLAPAGWLYAAAGAWRARRARPLRLDVPVFCVGNLTAGGTGKTPVALALGAHLLARGRRPVFLSRGHGGRLVGPVRVDPAAHDAAAVGDEPLLLAAVAPTVIARDRAAGARAALALGADAVVMDDGLQNPSLAKTLRICVVDGETGFGNGRAIPAGPLRVDLARGLADTDLFVIMGPAQPGLAARLAAHAPVLAASLHPDPDDAAVFRGRRVLAFAGIGRPAKFFATLAACGAELVGTAAFPDHHRYRAGELAALAARARAAGAVLATTAKDRVRLPPALRGAVAVLAVTARFAPESALFDRVDRCLDG